MRTIRLKIHDDVYDKLMWFLNKFSIDEVEVIQGSEDSAGNLPTNDAKKAQTQYDEIERNLELALKKYKTNK